jgi:sulfide dehydrogenase cytochrome subunit
MSLTRAVTFALTAATVAVAATACATPPAPPPAKPPSAAAAANMAANCFSCHGPNGVSPGSIPSLHTLTASNITAYMKAFGSGERPSTVMGRHAKGYNDAEIEAIAQHIAGLNKK